MPVSSSRRRIFLAPRHALARKVLQHAKLQGLPLVATGQHQQVEPHVVKHEMTAQPESLAGGQHLGQLGCGGTDALLEGHRLQGLGGEPLQVAQAPALRDARPARPVLITGDGLAPLAPILEELEVGGRHSPLALALDTALVPVGQKSGQRGPAAGLLLAVAAVHQR